MQGMTYPEPDMFSTSTTLPLACFARKHNFAKSSWEASYGNQCHLPLLRSEIHGHVVLLVGRAFIGTGREAVREDA